MSERQYLIWSIEHDAWWRAGECGYTLELLEAGVYTERRARAILERANRVDFNECLVPLECVGRIRAVEDEPA